jgi:hypothetical protein
VIRQVKSLHVACDKVGNSVLVKFSCIDAKDVSALFPASVVFWLLKHIPPNRNPDLQRPPPSPVIEQHEWDDSVTPRVSSVNCKQFADGVRMTMELNTKPDLGVLLNASNLELMRLLFDMYRPDLMDLDAG